MLRIRLQRLGRKKQATYRFIVSERFRDTQHGSIEILGHYNPQSNPKVIDLKQDRIDYWLSVGAQPSDTVHNILVNAGALKAKKTNPVSITAKRAKKMATKKAEEAKKSEPAA